MFDDADSDGEVEVIKEGTSSSSAAVQESEASEQVADGVKSKAKSSKKKAPAVSPMKDIKPALEESSKTPSKEYPNPRNAKVLDSYILPYENDCSDHCPICLIVERNI